VWKHYENVPPTGREEGGRGGCKRTERRRTPARVQVVEQMEISWKIQKEEKRSRQKKRRKEKPLGVR
jgi:hypothetical protein